MGPMCSLLKIRTKEIEERTEVCDMLEEEPRKSKQTREDRVRLSLGIAGRKETSKETVES